MNLRPGAWLAGSAGALLLLLPAGVHPTTALWTDAAAVTTGTVAAGAFVPAPSNAVRCETSDGGTVARFTTDLVTPPTRGSVEYVLRVVRVDVTPNVLVAQVLMTTSGSTATTAFGTGGLTLLSSARYEARVTTRLLGQTRESSPAQTSTFTVGGVLLLSFTCRS